MKKTIVSILLFGIITLSFAQEKANRYAIKSGHVEYELKGNTTGTRSVWWDNYGDKTYTEENTVTVTNFMGMTSREELHTINITIGDKYWDIDLTDNTGQKGTLEYYDDAQQYANSLTEEEAKQLEEEILASFGGERLGTENILGYPCEVIAVLGVKSWIYKGILLKKYGAVMGISTDELAKSFDKNCNVPSSKFAPPSGIDFEDVDAKKASLYGDMMDETDDSPDNEDELAPLSYSYSNFLKGIAPISQLGYIRTVTDNTDGQYTAVFMKGLLNGLAVVATSHVNLQAEGDHDLSSLEKFSHNGKTCYYGTNDGEVVLAVEYMAKNMIVLFAPTIYQSKEQLLKVSDKCSF